MPGGMCLGRIVLVVAIVGLLVPGFVEAGKVAGKGVRRAKGQPEASMCTGCAPPDPTEATIVPIPQGALTTGGDMRAELPAEAPGPNGVGTVPNIVLEDAAAGPTVGMEAEMPWLVIQYPVNAEVKAAKHFTMWRNPETGNVIELDSTEQFDEWALNLRGAALPFRHDVFDLEFVQRRPADMCARTEAVEGINADALGVFGNLKREAIARYEAMKTTDWPKLRRFFTDYMYGTDIERHNRDAASANKPPVDPNAVSFCELLELFGRSRPPLPSMVRNSFFNALMAEDATNHEFIVDLVNGITLESAAVGLAPGFRIFPAYAEFTGKDDCKGRKSKKEYHHFNPAGGMQVTTTIPLETLHGFLCDGKVLALVDQREKTKLPRVCREAAANTKVFENWSTSDQGAAMMIGYYVLRWRDKSGDFITDPKNDILWLMSRTNFVSMINAVKIMRVKEGFPADSGLPTDAKGLRLMILRLVYGIDNIEADEDYGMITSQLFDKRVGKGERPDDQVLGTTAEGFTIGEWLDKLVDPEHPEDLVARYEKSMGHLGVQVRAGGIDVIVELRDPVKTDDESMYNHWSEFFDRKCRVLAKLFGACV